MHVSVIYQYLIERKKFIKIFGIERYTLKYIYY